MIVNGEDIKGVIIKDQYGHPIVLLTDEGAYYFKGYTVEVMDKDMAIHVDQEKGIIEVIDSKNQLNQEISSGQKVEVLSDKKAEEETDEDVIVEISDYMS